MCFMLMEIILLFVGEPPSPTPSPVNVCSNIVCGNNAHCSNGICGCVKDYVGNPQIGCRPECVLNSECARNKACIRSKCVDPCPSSCGQLAICNVINHLPICNCPEGYTGNAFVACAVVESMLLYN